MTAIFEDVTGRYMTLEVAGERHRIYVEQAGVGIPLVCLHTAGSDSRQYRHLMNDATITRRFQVTCFDMPWHGKSSAPAGWRSREYQLTADRYTEMIHTVLDALGLERPVVLGCSIGGRIVLKLARDRPERFRALIGLQSGARVAPYYDREYLDRPDVNAQELCVALMSGLMAPNAPSADRDETLWHYAQGGPGVFKGDLHFYQDESDDDSVLALIDTAKCPLYLLTGEWDYSCLPTDTLYLAERIAGVEPVIMKDLGHFPMSENHPLFMSYLAPVLDRIAGQA